jgi:hypothetical protein
VDSLASRAVGAGPGVAFKPDARLASARLCSSWRSRWQLPRTGRS